MNQLLNEISLEWLIFNSIRGINNLHSLLNTFFMEESPIYYRFVYELQDVLSSLMNDSLGLKKFLIILFLSENT